MEQITVTKEQVAENMKDYSVRTIEEFGKKITFVTVRMRNGFVLWDASTCVDPAHYDQSIGAEICLKRIENKVWELLGYSLADSLYYSNLIEKYGPKEGLEPNQYLLFPKDDKQENFIKDMPIGSIHTIDGRKEKVVGHTPGGAAILELIKE